MKIDRQKVYVKYGGHCAYCGSEIKYKDMQVDHIFPQAKSHWIGHQGMKKHSELYGNIPNDINQFDNLNPSCRRCNYHKNTLDIEQFREVIAYKIKMLNNYYAYSVAKDYGLVKETAMPVLFYFEKASE